MSDADKRNPLATLVADQLSDDFEGKVPHEKIEEVVESHADDFADARVVNFVPTLLARRAREDLKNLADDQAEVPPEGWEDEDPAPPGPSD